MKKIIEIEVHSSSDYSKNHVMECAKHSIVGMYDFNISSVKIRNFQLPDGGYNKDGKFFTINAFNKNKKEVVEACYHELIEAEITLKRNF